MMGEIPQKLFSITQYGYMLKNNSRDTNAFTNHCVQTDETWKNYINENTKVNEIKENKENN